MQYPTMDEVNSASHTQLGYWHRFLPSPGWNSIRAGEPTDEIEAIMNEEITILNRIEERFKEMGGMMPWISKSIGWGD